MRASLFVQFYRQALKLVTQIRQRVKDKLPCLIDKRPLSKTTLNPRSQSGEFDLLKDQINLAHYTYRSPSSFCINLLVSLFPYFINIARYSHALSP